MIDNDHDPSAIQISIPSPRDQMELLEIATDPTATDRERLAADVLDRTISALHGLTQALRLVIELQRQQAAILAATEGGAVVANKTFQQALDITGRLVDCVDKIDLRLELIEGRNASPAATKE